jgi:hypothetical protein
VLSLDVMGISGEQQRDISHNILKKRITPTGVDMPASRARTSAMISTSLLNDARTGIVARAMVESRQQVGAVTRVKRFDRRIQTRGGVSVIPTVSSR